MIELKCFSYDWLPQWQKDIIFRYPDIYLTPDARIAPHYMEGNKSFCNLRLGFEFEQGWQELAEEFSSVADQLVKQLRQSGLEPDAFIRAYVFKEKFGRLQWQGSHNLVEPFKVLFNGYAAQLSVKSVHVCELTGQPGALRNIEGMMKTLCEQEYERFLDKYARPCLGTKRQKA